VTPRIWAVLGDKTGDNAQVEAIAARLPWPVEPRQLVFLPRYRKGKPLFGASLRHLDRSASAPLQPPWPDLVITIGRRPAMAALWIRRQSGGRTRIAIIGRPKRRIDEFDLVIASAQYRLPDAPNVVHVGLPLMRVDPERFRAAAAEWAPTLAQLPRPLVVLLVGGATKPYRLDPATASDLLRTARAYAGAGTVYVSTSRRTSPAVVETLRRELPDNGRLYEVDSSAPNPYLALLGSGDLFVITGDSMSMLTETARLGRRVAIYSLPFDLRWRWVSRFRGILQRLGAVGFERDLGAFHQWLYAHNRAVPAAPDGDPGWESRRPAGSAMPPDDALDRVVARIRALLEPASRATVELPQSGTEEPSR
jgi:mitochondrial fission protein ELM1